MKEAYQITYKILAIILLCLSFSAFGQQAQQSSIIFSPAVMTATSQTSSVIHLSSQPKGSPVSYSTGTITVTGSSLTTATFAVNGSSDGGKTFYALNISAINAPGTTATTETVTTAGVYQVNLSGITDVEFVTSGTFTATNISITLTASPNGIIARNTGGGGGSVSSVTGTANQVDVTGTTTPVVSLDPAIVNPGTQVGYQVNNVFYVDGFTTAGFPGIGVAQTAWSSGSYPLCTAVSNSGSNYLAVGTPTTTTPGTNSAIWWPVQNGNTPTQLDCAFYYAQSQALAIGSANSIHLGESPFSTPYLTNIGLLEAANQLHTNIIGDGRGWNGGPTRIKVGQPISYAIATTNQSGSSPYDFVIDNIYVDGGGLLTGGCFQIQAQKVGHISHIGCQNWNNTLNTVVPVQFQSSNQNSYQFLIDDVYVAGAGNAPSSWATVTASGTGTTLTFAISGTNTYFNLPQFAYLFGYSSNGNPCTVMGTGGPAGSGLTTTSTGSVGSYTLTGITMSGFSGCTGPYFVAVPDISAAPYGIEISNLTDSTTKDLVVNNAGRKYGIFYNGTSEIKSFHEHVYGGQFTMIADTNPGDVHLGAEIDTPEIIGIVTGNSVADVQWTDTTLATGGLAAVAPGVTLFAQHSGGHFTIDNSACGNAATSANVFALVALSATGPVAYGGNYTSAVNVINAQHCDTLLKETALAGKVTIQPSSTTTAPLNVGAGTAPSAPVNGDVWSTSSGLYAQINSATVGPFSAGGTTPGCTLGCSYVLTMGDDSTAVGANGNHLTTTEQPLVTQFFNPLSRKLGNACINVTTVSSGGHMDVGVYNSSGSLVWHTGSFSTTSGGVQCFTPSAATLTAGTYYAAICADNIVSGVLNLVQTANQQAIIGSGPAHTAGSDTTVGDACTAGVLASSITLTNIVNSTSIVDIPYVYASN